MNSKIKIMLFRWKHCEFIELRYGYGDGNMVDIFFALQTLEKVFQNIQISSHFSAKLFSDTKITIQE